jgi:hypothetical protein
MEVAIGWFSQWVDDSRRPRSPPGSHPSPEEAPE